MEPFDDLKGKLREEAPLPEGFGWENMQVGIFEKMDQIDHPKKETKRFAYWRFTFFLLGMAVMLGAVLLLNWATESTNERESTTPIIATSKLNQSTEAVIEKTALAKNIKKNTTQGEGNIIDAKIPINHNHSSDFTAKVIADAQKNATPTKGGTTSSKQIKIETKKPNAIRLNNGKEKKQVKNNKFLQSETEQLEPKKEIIIAFERVKVEQQINTAPPTIPEEMPSLEKSLITNKKRPFLTLNPLTKKTFKVFNYLHSTTINPPLFEQSLALEKQNLATRFSIALGAGGNYWQPNWGNTTASQERAQTETALWGNTYSLLFDYWLKPNWSVASGILWSKHYSKFDYHQVDNYQKVKNNALVEIQVNTFTGDSTQIYGDRTINVERTRQVVHYNAFRKWAIPVSIKYSLQKRKLEYIFGIGTMLTLNTETSGKTLNATIIDYDTTNPIYKSSFAIGGMGSFGLNYHFSKKYYVGTQLAIVKELANWNQTDEVVLKPTLFHNQIIIGMKF